MKCRGSLVATFVALLVTADAASWSFTDAQLTVSGKSSGVGGGVKHQLSNKSPYTDQPISLSTGDALKIVLTTQDGGSGKKPSQAYLQLQDPTSGLEDAFAFSVKESGKAKVEISQKDIPTQLLSSSQNIKASIIIASFGSSTPYKQHAFDLAIQNPEGGAAPVVSDPERYSKKEEIDHIFRSDPKSPPKVISLFFTLAVLATLPILVGSWAILGANLEHISKAFGAAPLAHGLFVGSILGMEGVFFLYYTSWNLFQTMPAAALVGVVGYISGSRALTEVQERRLAGQR